MKSFQGTAWDLETCLIRPGLPAPPPVCLTWSNGAGLDPEAVESGIHIQGSIGPGARLCLKWDNAGHNIAYDMGVILEWCPELQELIVRAYEEDRVFDTMLLERLGQITGQARMGPLALDEVAVRWGFPRPEKDDEIRLTFGQFLLGKPLTPRHEAYAIGDATLTHSLLNRQLKHINVTRKDLAEMSRTAFWRHMISARGLRTDPAKIEQLKVETRKALEQHRDLALTNEFIRLKRPAEIRAAERKAEREGKPAPTNHYAKCMKAIKDRVTDAYEGRPPKTKKDGISTARETLEDSGDPILEQFASYTQSLSIETKDLPLLLAGVDVPIHTRWGWAATFRSTSSKPNIQNLRGAPGIRECFIPRPGYCYLQFDIGGLELATMAQVLVWNHGRWGMANDINSGVDRHSKVAATLMGITYEDALLLKAAEDPELDRNRAVGKVAAFGKQGGMAWGTLVSYGRGMTPPVRLTKEFCEGPLRVAWDQANPDVLYYLSKVRDLRNAKGLYDVLTPGTDIVRRDATYCAAANHPFQSLGARVTGNIGWHVMKECLPGGSMEGCHPVAFVHDEWILECPIGMQHEMGEIAKVLVTTKGEEIMPDVRIETKPVAMAYWSKKAKAVFNEGRLGIYGN